MIKQLDQSALEWLGSRAFLLAKSMNETTKLALRESIAEGFTQGESIQQLTKRISTYFDTQSRYRARMIARTEVIAANNEGALHRYETEGIEKSEFFPAPDACEECTSLAGEYPTRESHGVIPVHPNCRCVFMPVV